MKKIILFILILFLTTHCGFKVVDQNFYRFEISEVTTLGEKRINYIIKNKLFAASEKGKDKLIKIQLDTKKTKNIKEKNIKNSITKYELIITTEVSFGKFNAIKLDKFNVKVFGAYDVSKQSSITRNNEKQLIKLLTNKISDQILNELKSKLDDL